MQKQLHSHLSTMQNYEKIALQTSHLLIKELFYNRGVENHRYRLRKKMGLDHDDSLIDLILEL